MSRYEDTSADEVHIASLVVHLVPDTLSRVEPEVVAIDGACVHGSHPSGKLVVTLDGPSASVIMEKIAKIQQLAGVINVSLVYQHAEAYQLMNQETAS